MKNYLPTTSIILAWVSIGLPQSNIDTLKTLNQNNQGNILFSNFNKILNTYYLNTGFNLYGEYSDLSMELNENFRSTYFQSTTKSIRDEQYFNFNTKYRLNNISNIGLSVNSSILSDDRNILLNESNINYFTLFSELNFKGNILFTPFGGYTTNKQLGETDTGPVYGFEGSTENLSFPGFTINSDFNFQNEDISPRKNLLRYLNLSITNPFNPSVTNMINSRYSSARKDFYFLKETTFRNKDNTKFELLIKRIVDEIRFSKENGFRENPVACYGFSPCRFIPICTNRPDWQRYFREINNGE